MLYKDAKRLVFEDEVIDKKTGRILSVVHTKIDKIHRRVYIFCDDGRWYDHKRVR